MSNIPKEKIEKLLKEIRDHNDSLNISEHEPIEEDLSSLPPIPLDTEMEFRIKGSILPYLRNGWGESEPTRIWSIDQQCDLILKLPETSSDLLLSIKGEQFIKTGLKGSPIELWLDNTMIGSWPEDCEAQLNTLILREQLPVSGVARLIFKFEKPRSPQSLGISEDNRLLGFSFKSILIKEIK